MNSCTAAFIITSHDQALIGAFRSAKKVCKRYVQLYM